MIFSALYSVIVSIRLGFRMSLESTARDREGLKLNPSGYDLRVQVYTVINDMKGGKRGEINPEKVSPVHSVMLNEIKTTSTKLEQHKETFKLGLPPFLLLTG